MDRTWEPFESEDKKIKPEKMPTGWNTVLAFPVIRLVMIPPGRWGPRIFLYVNLCTVSGRECFGEKIRGPHLPGGIITNRTAIFT